MSAVVADVVGPHVVLGVLPRPRQFTGLVVDGHLGAPGVAGTIDIGFTLADLVSYDAYGRPAASDGSASWNG